MCACGLTRRCRAQRGRCGTCKRSGEHAPADRITLCVAHWLARASRRIIYDDANKAAVGRAGAIDALVPLLAPAAPALCRERAAGCLRDLCVSVPEHRVEMARAGAIQALTDILANGTPLAKERAAGCLW